MIHWAKGEAEKYLSDVSQFIKQDSALFVTPMKSEPKNIAVARQVVLKALCETLILVFTNGAGLIEVLLHPNVVKSRACMTAKGTTEVYRGCPSYITIAIFDMLDGHLSKHERVDEVKNTPKEIVHIKDKRFLYLSGAHTNSRDNSVHAKHYKPTRTAWNKRLSTKPSRRKTKRSSKRIGERTFRCQSGSRPTNRPSSKCSKN